MEKISCLIFDLDGTLIDSAEDIFLAVDYTLRKLGAPGRSRAEVHGFIGDGMKQLLAKSLGSAKDNAKDGLKDGAKDGADDGADENLVQRAIEIFRPYYKEHCAENTKIYPEVLEMLQYYQSRKLAIVTNKPFEMTQRLLQYFSIEHYFSSVLGGDSTKHRKPHAEPLLQTMQTLRCAPQETLMIGDGTADLQAAKAASVKSCAVTYGYRSWDELKNFQPDYKIDRLSELKQIVQ